MVSVKMYPSKGKLLMTSFALFPLILVSMITKIMDLCHLTRSLNVCLNLGFKVPLQFHIKLFMIGCGLVKRSTYQMPINSPSPSISISPSMPPSFESPLGRSSQRASRFPSPLDWSLLTQSCWSMVLRTVWTWFSEHELSTHIALESLWGSSFLLSSALHSVLLALS